MALPTVVVAAIRLVSGLADSTRTTLLLIGLLLWDLTLTIYNLLAPLHPAERVVREGLPGADGLWPEYIPPGKTDSRSCCPVINALANHGILPRDGRNISFKELNDKCCEAFNVAPSFSFFVPYDAATMLERDYATGTFDLEDISAHNCIEHDASLCREDTFLHADQSKPAPRLINALLESATGPDGTLTTGDVSRMLGRRRAESRRENRQYSQGFSHKLFGSTNASLMLAVFGGRVKDLRPLLLEERIPDGWQPRVRKLGVQEEIRGALAKLGMGGRDE